MVGSEKLIPEQALKLLREIVTWRYIAKLALIAGVYIAAAKLGLSLAVATKQVTTIWPPTGIALATIILGGYRYLPGILAGAFTANLFTLEPATVAAGIAVGNTLEAFTGAYLLRRVVKFTPTLETAREFVAYIVLGGLAATAVSATIGTLSLSLDHMAKWPSFWSIWSTWWAGDMMGGLIVGPFLLLWVDRNLRAALRKNWVGAGILAAVIFAASILAFSVKISPPWPLPLAAYITFPLMIWTAFKWERIGVSTATIIVALVALWATLNDMGPFANGPFVEHNLIFLQSFILVVFVSSMFLAITVARRTRAEHKLQSLTVQLTQANQRATDTLAEMLEQATPRSSSGVHRKETGPLR